MKLMKQSVKESVGTDVKTSKRKILCVGVTKIIVSMFSHLYSRQLSYILSLYRMSRISASGYVQVKIKRGVLSHALSSIGA